VSARGGGGKTALHLAGDGVVARALIAQGADINAQDDHGGTPLHQLDDAGAILAVIATGGDLNTRNDTGQVPMMTGSEDKALLLFAAGADPTLRDDRGVSVRAYAREKGWTRLLAKLGD
jgi:ankyrin repeat protein